MPPLPLTFHRDPDQEVVPGVKWGRPEWVPSPAFWFMLAQDPGQQTHDYVAPPGTPLHHEIGFCLLGGHGIKMEMNRAAWVRLRDTGIFEIGRRPPAHEIEILLRAPLLINGRLTRYRFPQQRAERLAVALRAIEDQPPPISSSKDFRRSVMRLPGIGPKTASWLARNWLGSDDVAVIDIHVLRAGQKMNLFSHSVNLPADYDDLEEKFLLFARGLAIKPSLLDAIIWRHMRLLGRYFAS